MKTSRRKTKLHARSRPSRSSNNGLKQVPWLNISGLWLEEAGFGINTPVMITIKENQLIITPAETHQ